MAHSLSPVAAPSIYPTWQLIFNLMHIKTGQERERKVKNEGGLVSVTFGFTLLMAFWPHFNLHASTKGQTQDTVTQRTHTHTHPPSHTQLLLLLLSRRGSNCRWQHFTRGVWQVRQGRIKVGRKDTPPAAAPLLQLLPFFSCCPYSDASPSPSSSAASAKCALGTFLVYSFFLFLYIFSTCTKHLPSIFADTFYTVSTFSLPLSPLLVLAVCSATTRSCCFICSRCLSECVRCPSLNTFNGLFCQANSTLTDWLRQESLFVGD